MRTLLARLLAVALAIALVQKAGGQEPPERRDMPPSLLVTGEGRAAAAPDRAVIRLGAVAQADDAAAAQAEVNQVMQQAVEAIRALGIPEAQISTAGIELSPVYTQPPHPLPRDAGEPLEPRIVGYRASNTVRVQIDELKLVGQVIDAGVDAGANQIEGLSFELKDDTQQRREALRLAVRSARTKAEAIAEALGVRLAAVLEVQEGGVHVLQPRMERFGRAMMAEAAPTPVQPGQVQVEAMVTVRYRIDQSEQEDAETR